ncbi:MAG: DUF433 domain-containing protein [Syntrophales bacterium]
MSLTARKLDYPYITSDSGIAGGRPVIVGTRITVNCIAGYYQLGMSIDEILDSLHHLTPSQVHSALAYYFDHQDEINSDLEEAGNVEYWKGQVQSPSARQ